MKRVFACLCVTVVLVATNHLALFAQTEQEAPFKLWVTHNNKAFHVEAGPQFTQIGEIIPVEHANYMEYARDIVAVPALRCIAIYNGTFTPKLSFYDLTSHTWRHEFYPTWSTFNNISYGGIALFGRALYATDMITYPDSEHESGLVQFLTDGSLIRRLINSREYIDVNIGPDYTKVSSNSSKVITPTKIFALRRDERTVDLISSRGSPRALRLSRAVRAIAVDHQNGDIYGASWDGSAYRFNPNGTLTKTLLISDFFEKWGFTSDSLTDIDIKNGLIAIGSKNGLVYMANTFDFSTSYLYSFSLSGQGEYYPTFIGFAN